ncbi:MAG: phosphoenolpyruvate mutase [Defluviitaleaceae bacterium]|nr:phosphoenolpyruvate mutase [Defluviitaleaceae bacterium]MCL2274415.1 phosphoenolpyruvate mutase [Defluviitaleaceae bacterium]
MKVYLVMTSEIIHNAHIKLINKAAEMGELTVGVYTNQVLESLGRVPIMSESDRMAIFSSIKGVSNVVLQDEAGYEKNLRMLKPDIVIRGDNKSTRLEKERQIIMDVLAEWGGQLVEVPYTKGLPADEAIRNISMQGYLPEVRRRKLNYYLKNRPLVRIIEAHNGLTGLIAEKTSVDVNGQARSFDGMWISSLCDSTAKGKPDIELVDHSSRLQTIQEIMDVTTKPIILDGDSGGLIEHFVHNLKSIERSGVSAIIIEDKIGLKQNSLIVDSGQNQDSIENFAEKIRQGKKATMSRDFSIIARIESLILGNGLEDAVERAKAYINAGADGIMIHSNKKAPDEVFAFCDEYVKFGGKIPLVAVPTTYNTVTEEELVKRGVRVVIHANHLLRSAFPAMKKTAEAILQHGRSLEADEMCMSIKEILTLIPG